MLLCILFKNDAKAFHEINSLHTLGDIQTAEDKNGNRIEIVGKKISLLGVDEEFKKIVIKHNSEIIFEK